MNTLDKQTNFFEKLKKAGFSLSSIALLAGVSYPRANHYAQGLTPMPNSVRLQILLNLETILSNLIEEIKKIDESRN